MSWGVLMLLGVTLVWGTTFPLMKSITADMNGVEICVLRFVIAAACMMPLLRKAPLRAWADGLLLGILGLASYVAQAYGLQHISSNRSAFLTSLNVLMVPLLGLLFGERLSRPLLLAAFLACLGIALMSWESGGNLRGDLATIVCALAYALYIIVLSQRSKRHAASHLAATQITVMAMLAALWMLLQSLDSGTLATLPSRIGPHAGALLYLGVCATAGMLFLQALAQRNVAAGKAALIYAMEPVFAALFGWIWLGEMLGWRGMIGGALVIGAIILSERIRPASAPVA